MDGTGTDLKVVLGHLISFMQAMGNLLIPTICGVAGLLAVGWALMQLYSRQYAVNRHGSSGGENLRYFVALAVGASLSIVSILIVIFGNLWGAADLGG